MVIANSWRLSIIGAAVAAAVGLAPVAGYADNPITSFTAGDLVVLRGGDATNPNTSSVTTMVSLYLDEYTAAGSYVGTMAVPSTGGSPLTLPGIGDFQHNGVLNLSTNGRLLTFAGYQTAVGSADAFAQLTAATQYQPVIGVIGNTAASLTTNTVVNSYNNGSSNPYIRGATTNDGTSFWTFGKYAASAATSNGGLSYVSGTGPSATTTTVEGFADWRDIVLANGQIYGGTGSSSVGAHAPYIVNQQTTANGGTLSAGGGGPITSPSAPTTNLGNALTLNTQIGSYAQSASALALVKVAGDPNSQNGLNVVYTIGDQSNSGIVKYYYDGTTWQNFGNVELAGGLLNPTGLIAAVDPGNSNWVDITVSGTNGIYTYVDKNGYNGAIPADSFSLVAAAPQNEAFYGIASAPVPEPASLTLLMIGASGLLLRRRKA